MAAGAVNGTAGDASAVHQAPWPLVTFKRHPLRAVINQIVTFSWLIVVGYVGIKIIAGAYYLIFELYPPLTREWHAAVPDSALRHDIRDVAEGYYATVLAHAFVFNPWKKNGLLSGITPFKQINHLATRLESALHLPVPDSHHDPSKSTAVLWLALTFVYAVPGFLIGRWAVQEVSNVLLHFQATAGLLQPHAADQAAPLWNRELSTVASGWPKKAYRCPGGAILRPAPRAGSLRGAPQVCCAPTGGFGWQIHCCRTSAAASGLCIPLQRHGGNHLAAHGAAGSKGAAESHRHCAGDHQHRLALSGRVRTADGRQAVAAKPHNLATGRRPVERPHPSFAADQLLVAAGQSSADRTFRASKVLRPQV